MANIRDSYVTVSLSDGATKMLDAKQDVVSQALAQNDKALHRSRRGQVYLVTALQCTALAVCGMIFVPTDLGSIAAIVGALCGFGATVVAAFAHVDGKVRGRSDV